MRDDNKPNETKNRKLSRRDFMGAAAAATAFTVVPRHVLGGPRQVAPSEKLNIAGIGIGGQGGHDIDQFKEQNIVALCDVDWRHASRTFRRYPDAKKYKDFREMLDKEDKNIDGVVVGTPDHTHAIVSMAAIKRDKHVYCEKPLTHTVLEAKMLAEAAREHKVATQMGNQGQASEETRLMCEAIWDGAIGQVREVHIWTDRPLNGIDKWYWPQGVDRPEGEDPIPDTLDWDLWVGPAPMRPYVGKRTYNPFVWRGWWDFGTGALGDIGCHSMDPVFRALKLGYPTSVEACCTLVNNETYPVASRVTYEFPARGDMAPVKLHWYDGGMKPPRPAELEDGRNWDTNGQLYVGDKGKMLGCRLIPETRQQEYGKPPQKLERSPGHYKEWVIACKGGKPAGSNFPDHAGLLAQVVLMGNIALRPALKKKLLSTKLFWDAGQFKFTNMPEANQYLTKEYRQGWAL
ncbi:MAG: Gfo/Idh/MocA family oxidoreductase [Sedimentisphaerales bacterium]|nr:Gfo/Idh/MocA family oxidoreductase [Sedimentisphaerales bacterium]